MTSEKQRIIQWLYRQMIPVGEHRFDDLLIVAVQDALEKDAIASSAYAVSNAARLWNAVVGRCELDLQKGRQPLLKISNREHRRYSNGWDAAGAPARMRRAITRAASRPKILAHIDSLNDREFEALGCSTAQLLGADRTLLTPAGNERGVDFFARLQTPGLSHVFSGHACPIRIIGQCKMYDSQVPVDKVREFITAIDEVRHQNATMLTLMPDWFQSSGGLIVGWMIAWRGFQSGTATLARNHGIVLSDAVDIAEVFAKSRKHVEHLDAQQRASHLVSVVRQNLGVSVAVAPT